MASSMIATSEGSFSVDLYSSLEITETASGASESPRVLSVLSSLMEKVVGRNDKLAATLDRHPCQQKLTVFHGLRAPNISIQSYIQRIFKYANCSPACFVVAYAYIDRFIHQQPDIPITSLNVHRLLITSVMAAAKFFDDAYYNNAYYAKVGGVNALEMNRLELDFLFNLDFRLHVTVSTFESYCSYLEKEVALVGSHKIERPVKFVCGFDDGYSQERSQQQSVPFPV